MIRKLIGNLIAASSLLLATIVPAQQETVRMVVTDLNYRPAFQAVARAYQEIHPNVRVDVEIISPGGYATWIRTALAGGVNTAPDIYSFNMASGFYESGKAINIKPYLDAISPYTGKPWRESFIPEYLEMLSVGNETPQIPLNYVEIGIFYNRDIFDRVGVEVPETWEELLEVCEAIKQAGYIPLAMPADKEAYWGGVVGWVVRLFTDVWYLDKVPTAMAREGDFLYDERFNKDFEVSFDDPFNDLMVRFSTERRIQSILDGDLDFDGPRMREVYTYLKDFSRFWQPGFHAADPISVYQLFLRQEAAMMFNASPAVLVLERDISRLQPQSRFEWGAFHPPRITSSELVRTPFRGVGAPLPVFGIIRKSREQNDRAADFLKFLTSPQMAKLILEESIKAEEAIIGPFAIQDVPLDEEMDAKFRPFLGHGREKLEIRGLEDEQESVWRWSTIAQDYMAGRITMDDFLERYQRLMVQTIPNVIKRYDLDMDPTTRDNNRPLIIAIENLLNEVRSGTSEVSGKTGLIGFLLSALTEQAYGITTNEDSFFDLIVERTIPIKIALNDEEYSTIARDAEKIATREGVQYILLIRLDGSEVKRHQVFNFRPSLDEVIKGLSGKRYSQEELRRIFR